MTTLVPAAIPAHRAICLAAALGLAFAGSARAEGRYATEIPPHQTRADADQHAKEAACLKRCNSLSPEQAVDCRWGCTGDQKWMVPCSQSCSQRLAPEQYDRCVRTCEAGRKPATTAKPAAKPAAAAKPAVSLKRESCPATCDRCFKGDEMKLPSCNSQCLGALGHYNRALEGGKVSAQAKAGVEAGAEKCRWDLVMGEVRKALGK
jgi:hypothetical protein